MAKIDVLIQVRDKFSNHFRRLNNALKRSAARFRVFARRVSGAMAVAFASIARGTVTINKFEKGVARIEALFGGKKDTGLRDAIRQIQLASGRSAQESVEGFYQALSRGVPKDNVYEFLRVAAKAAVVDGSTIQTSVEGITTVLNAFSMHSRDAEKVAEMMFATVADGATTFDLISTNIAQAAPTAAAMGVDVEELLGSLQVMTKQGITTSQSFTQLNAVMLAANKVLGDGWREQYTFTEAMEQMNTVASQQGKTLLQVVGREEAFRAIMALTGSQALETADAIDKLREGSNKLDEALAGTTGTAIKIDQAFQAFKLSGESAFKGIINLFPDFGSGLTRILQSAAVDLNAFAEDPSWDKIKSALVDARILAFGSQDEVRSMLNVKQRNREAAKRYEELKKRNADIDAQEQARKDKIRKDMIESDLKAQRKITKELEEAAKLRTDIEKQQTEERLKKQKEAVKEFHEWEQEQQRKEDMVKEFFANKHKQRLEDQRQAQMGALMFTDIPQSLPKQVDEFIKGREAAREAGDETHQMLLKEQKLRAKIKARGQGFKLSRKDQKFLDNLEHFRANVKDAQALEDKAPEKLMEEHLRKIAKDIGLVLEAAPH